MNINAVMDYLNKSLEELESMSFRRPEDSSSDLVKRIYIIRQKKLSKYSVEDLRLLIGQMQGLDYLIPLALAHLEDNPFIEGDYYEGDLLKNVLECNCEFWNGHLEEAKRMKDVVRNAGALIDNIELVPGIKIQLAELMQQYLLCISKRIDS